MKFKICLVLFAVTAIFSFNLSAAEKKLLNDENDRISYSIGLSIGSNFKQQSIDITMDPLMAGIKDALLDRKPLLTPQEIQATMEAFRKDMTTKMKKKKELEAGQNLEEGVQFLKKNAEKKGIITTASGLQYEILKEGTGATPKLTDTVVCHYTGTLLDGKVFDSSYKRNAPASFPVNGVIKGWTEALQLMKTGAKWKLYIPSNLAYGDRGAGSAIGPGATLVFDIELLEIKPTK
ncbi:MAG: FKBP-type peptidyl-prolyl cis-trans isomerase [SAR324 cluster bacterium]|nr:FKBP-type peptidyl-prolyl cis-trans isomerase [SAR324 cluster bacterium]